MLISQPSKKNLRCIVRKKNVVLTPEESIRQAILSKMIQQLGFSLEGFAVECSLNQLPHIRHENHAKLKRRADILYFANGQLDRPLLLIECKAVPLTSRVLRQVVGYNHFVKAHFIAVANQAEVRFGWFDSKKQDYTFISYMPTCQELA